MITENIYEAFEKVKNSLTPGKVSSNAGGDFVLTRKGVYLYRHSCSGLAEIIGFESKEAEEAYKNECIKLYNKFFYE